MARRAERLRAAPQAAGQSVEDFALQLLRGRRRRSWDEVDAICDATIVNDDGIPLEDLGPWMRGWGKSGRSYAAAMKPVVVPPRAYDDVRRATRLLIDKDINAANASVPALRSDDVDFSRVSGTRCSGVAGARQPRTASSVASANGYVIRYRGEATRGADRDRSSRPRTSLTASNSPICRA